MRMSEAQSLFKKNVLDGDVDPKSLPALKAVGDIPLKEGFEIYHDVYYSKLISALAKTFETVSWVLGRDLFHDLSVRFIEAQPIVTFKLSEYGSSFPDFLAATEKTRGIPFLQDLARFEWLLKDVNNAATPDAMPTEEVQELIHANNFKIQFVDAVGIFQSMYAVAELWQHRKEPRYTFEEINWNVPQSLLLYKKDNKILVESIDPTQAEVILDLKEGKDISEALSGFSEVISPADNTRLFQTMMRAGIIDDIILL